MTLDTRAQDLRRLKDSLESANKEHATKYEQVKSYWKGMVRNWIAMRLSLVRSKT
jgi:hypothetical protein